MDHAPDANTLGADMSSLPTSLYADHQNFPNVDAFLSQLDAVLRHRYAMPVGALFTYALAAPTSQKQPLFITGKLVFADSTVEARPARDYGSIYLGERWLSVKDVLDELRRLARADSTLDGRPCEYSIAAYYGGWRRQQTISGWPEWKFDGRDPARLGERRPFHEAVVRPNLRPYDSGAEAVKDWVWPESGGWSSHDVPAHLELVVVVPDSRARLGRVEWTGTELLINTEANIPREELQLQGVLGFGGGRPSDFFIDAPPESLTRPLPTGVQSAAVYLLHKRDGLLGNASMSAPGEEFRAAAGEPSIEDLAATDLSGGETDHVEFKPFVESGDPKQTEVVESIVAFSNSGGGRLYIGVTDEGIPQGVHVLKSRYKKEGSQAPEAARKWLEGLLRDKIKPTPKIDAKWVVVAGEPVLAVRVYPGTDGPYSTFEHKVLVRRSATNRMPDPKTELPALYGGLGIRGVPTFLASDDSEVG